MSTQLQLINIIIIIIISSSSSSSSSSSKWCLMEALFIGLNLFSFLSMRKVYSANIDLSAGESEFVTMLYVKLNQEDVWRSGVTAPRIISISTRYKWVVSFPQLRPYVVPNS